MFADIIKIATMLIKTIFKNSKKVQRIRNYVSSIKMQSASVFLDIAKFAVFCIKKCWHQQNWRDVSRDSDIFWIFLDKYNCAKFHHFRMCMTGFKEGDLFNPPPPPPPQSLSSLEKAHPEWD